MTENNDISIKKILDEVIIFLRNPENKTLIENTNSIINIFKSNQDKYAKLIGDIIISIVCIGSVFLFANFGYLAKENVGNLITLIIGAIIGSRFK